MKIQKLSNTIDIKRYLKELGVDDGGIAILASKAEIHLIRIENLHVGAANILKQDALSIGADLAVPRGTVVAKEPYVNTLLIASTKALKLLAKKELAQPFGLKELAKELQRIVKTKKPKHAKVMGIINANDDSFYNKSRFLASDAIETIKKMIDEGAEIIDIGAVSSRPNALPVTAKEEERRIKPILDLIAKEKLYEEVTFSVDSYQPLVIKQALDVGFRIVNDITGLQSDEVCQLIAQYKATAVIMHMQGTPQTMQKNPHYENVLDDIYTFFQERIQKAEAFGVKDIVLDVGIGFGKSVEDNFTLIANLEHFLSLQKEILVGASRKSLIDAVSPAPTQQRLAGTLALHLKAFENGASILRVHDVFDHVQALKIAERLMLS
jgi:dihydropteroate synthase